MIQTQLEGPFPSRFLNVMVHLPCGCYHMGDSMPNSMPSILKGW